MLLSFFVRGSTRIFWFTDTSILLRSRFEADLWFTDLFALLDPHLKASQTWFCSGLTLESQSNLVLFWSYTWKPVKLVIQILPYVFLLGLTLHCQPGCAFDFVTFVYLIWLATLMPSERLQIQLSWDFWKLRSCSNITFFLPEGLSETFIWCTSLLTLHPCFRKEIYIWCNVLCNVWSWMTCPSI